ncbi:MAG: helix-turn-helix domain-containing protein [Anaerolineales bacterium]
MLWSTAELAEKSGLTSRQIRNLINAGKIEAQNVGRNWVVSDEEARRFLKERGVLEEKEVAPSD